MHFLLSGLRLQQKGLCYQGFKESTQLSRDEAKTMEKNTRHLSQIKAMPPRDDKRKWISRELSDKIGFTPNNISNAENRLLNKKYGKRIQTDSTDYLRELQLPHN